MSRVNKYVPPEADWYQAVMTERRRSSSPHFQFLSRRKADKEPSGGQRRAVPQEAEP